MLISEIHNVLPIKNQIRGSFLPFITNSEFKIFSFGIGLENTVKIVLLIASEERDHARIFSVQLVRPNTRTKKSIRDPGIILQNIFAFRKDEITNAGEKIFIHKI